MSDKKKLVVIGNGMAGARFLEELVARDGTERYDIAVFGEEPYGGYNRTLLSSVLAGGHEPDEIFVQPLSWYRDHRIRLHAGVRANAVDLVRRVVRAREGIVEQYDALVFATGSRPHVPPIPGVRQESGALRRGVYAFRTLDDCHALLNGAAGCQRAAVIGGGLLGLEAARGLAGLGLSVDVVHLGGHVMEQQLDAAAGAVLKRSLEKLGLRVHLQCETERIDGDGPLRLVFAGGGRLECDLVVVATGIRPNVALARDAGLLVERGIVVGDDLRAAGFPDVYAIGECAQHHGRTYGLSGPIWDQARVVAQRLAGPDFRAQYTGSKVSTRLRAMGIEAVVLGQTRALRPEDEEHCFVDEARGVYQKLVVRARRLVGGILLGDVRASPEVLAAFESGRALAGRPEELLRAAQGAQAEAPDASAAAYATSP